MGKRRKHSDDSSDEHSSRSSASDSESNPSRSDSQSSNDSTQKKHTKSSKKKHSHKHDKHDKHSKKKHRHESPRSKSKTTRHDDDDEKQKERDRKAMLKMMETPEEKRLRRLEKKKRKHEKGHTKELFGYTNEANPFGDPNLLTQFKWHKKNEALSKQLHIPIHQIEKDQERSTRNDIQHEIEKLKKRRGEREEERRRWEEERMRMAREAEGVNGVDLDRKEEEFHRQQAKLRSEIRLRQSRAKPIDIIAKNLELSNEFDVEMTEPYKIFCGLHLGELRELREDIQGRIELGQHSEFWNCMAVICDDTLNSAISLAEESNQRGRLGRSGLHRMIELDVVENLTKKSHNELTRLQETIMSKLQQNDVDPEYWEALLKRVNVQKAKARLRDMHAEMLRSRLADLQKKSKIEDSKQLTDTRSQQRKIESALEDSDAVKLENTVENQNANENGNETVEISLHELETQFAEPLSPELFSRLGSDEEAISASEDEKNIRELRKAVIDQESRKSKLLEVGEVDEGDALAQAEARRGMEAGDSAFNIEVPISAHQALWWHDKYRPRKPRFFNRVNVGYEWNKYNQTHYDHDNPPPKTVQGYKFNIFYPDLIDPTETPQYFLEQGDNPDTCIIRFHAGPPYEDIAFKIVNKEWQYTRQSGFKCTFQRGVLHLYFNFKRFRYRR